MTTQVFDVTDKDNRHIRLQDLKQNTWTWQYLDFTKDARRNDGGKSPFAAGHLVDDVFFFVEPDGNQEVNLFIDEVVRYDAARK